MHLVFLMDVLAIASVLATMSVVPIALFTLLPILSKMSGWEELAEKYGHDKKFHGSVDAYRSGKIGAVNYNNCLAFGLNGEGLYLRTSGFFLGKSHPPILIPWRTLTVSEKRVFGTQVLEFNVTGSNLRIQLFCTKKEINKIKGYA